MFEAETEAEAKILASRPLWPRGLNISVQYDRLSQQQLCFLLQYRLLRCYVVPSPTVTCTGEMITARFARSVDRLLSTEYLSVASYYTGPENNCSYVTSEETDYVIIAIPFVGGDCNTTREVSSIKSMWKMLTYNKAVLTQGKPRDATVNFDTYGVLQ